MQDMDKKQFRHYLISSIILFVIILGIILASTFSFGWFFINNSVGANLNMQLQEQKILALPFNAFIYNEETNMVEEFSNQQSIELPAYDTVFIEKNVNSLVIYQIKVFGAKIAAEEEFTIELFLDDISENDLISSNFLSNVICVKCAVIEALQETENLQTDYIYNYARDYFETSSNLQIGSFIKNINNEYLKENSIIFTINNYTADENDSLTLYLEILYDPMLINNWLELNNMNITSEIVEAQNNIVEIESDLDCFVFN